MTPQPTPTEVSAQPENITPIFNPADGPAPVTPYPGDSVSAAVDGGTPPPPSQEEIEAARKELEDDMREAVPFNRLAIHTSFQRNIQAQLSSSKPEKVGMLCTAFRNFAEAEALLRG